MQDYRYETYAKDREPAMAYVPWQEFDGIYDNLEEAFRVGTIFPVLNKEFEGRRCCKS